jgi:putative tributyrin esterase
MNTGKYRFLKLILLSVFVLNLSFAVQAQKTKPNVSKTPVATIVAQVEDLRLNSKLMAREMPYQLIYPNDCRSAKAKTGRYPVIYLLHGLSGHFNNWNDKSKLLEYSRKYNFIIVMPEGENGWYTDSISENNDRFESYISEELIPEIDKKFRTIPDRNHRFIAGLSMGGYGSIKFGLKRPEMFALVGSFSGALGAADWTEKELGTKGAIAESILKVYGAADSSTRKENNIFQMVRDISADKIKNLPFIYLDCGTEDFLIKNNLDFVKLLNEKKIPHEFRELPGNHNWVFWDSQVQEFLRLSERFSK